MEQETKYTYITNESLESFLKNIGFNCQVKDRICSYSFVIYELQLKELYNQKMFKKVIELLKIALGGKQVYINEQTHKPMTIELSIENDTRIFPSMFQYHEALNNKPAGELLIGVDNKNKPITVNITKTKSILVGGSSGGGKSVCMHNLICSILGHSKPSECQIALIDLKKCEFTRYENVSHLKYNKIATDFRTAKNLLYTVCSEIDQRYKIMSQNGIRQATTKDFPILIVFIDEYAMLSAIDQETIDGYTSKIASVGRACNVYMVIATQHATNKTLSNVIRSNIQSRIGLRTTNSAQSICIIGTKILTELLGYGDAYISIDGISGLQRCQICSITDEDLDYILN